MFNLENLVRQNIWDLKPYSSARDEFTGKEGIFLDANENPFGILNRYPDPHQRELKSKLSEIKSVKPDNIFIGNGSDEVIDLTFRIFCNPSKDKAITFSPTYGMYSVSANINDVEMIEIPLDENFQIETKLLTDFLKNENIKLIFLCSPNNPTANLFRKSDILFILKNFNGIVFIDEAYNDFSGEKSWMYEVEKYPNLIVSQTFSKAFGLAAARVGIAYSNREIIKLFNKVKPPYNVSELNQKAAINALNNLEEFEIQKKLILNEKKNLIKAFKKIRLIKKIFPSDANFILVEVTNANGIYNQLVEQKIITRNRHSIVNNCIRITVGTPNENQKLIQALQKIT